MKQQAARGNNSYNASALSKQDCGPFDQLVLNLGRNDIDANEEKRTQSQFDLT